MVSAYGNYDKEWPYHCCTVHVNVVIHFCYNVRSFWVEMNLCRFVLVCLHLYWHCRSNYQGDGWDPTDRFNPSTFSCLSQDLDHSAYILTFLCSMVWGESCCLILMILVVFQSLIRIENRSIIWISMIIDNNFSKSLLCQLREKSCHPVFTKCGEA